MNPQILIADDVHEVLFDYLNKAGLTYDYQPFISPEKLKLELPKYEGLIIRSKCQVNETVLREAKKLKFIARAGAGLDNIDETYALERGIVLLNAAEGNRDAVAEQACGMLLSLCHNINRGDQEVRQGLWRREENRGHELSQKTVGIIGYGNTGSSLARKLSGLGCRIMAYDKYKSGFDYGRVESVNMTTLYKHADVISLHIPLTAETYELVNRAWLQHFQKPIILMNLSRGKIVKTRDVIEALDHGNVSAFATDVLENEKLNSLDKQQSDDFNALIARPDVLLTPHVAGWTFESYKKISITLGRKIVSLNYEKNR